MENEGGGFMSMKFMGIPAIVWIGGAAILVYFLMKHNSQSSQPTNRTSGGGGTVKTGKTVVRSGAVRIDVNGTGVGNPQPKPPHGGFKTKSFTVPKNETLEEFGLSRHWSQDTFNDMAHFAQPSGSTYEGKTLNPDTKLKKGDKIFRQLGN